MGAAIGRPLIEAAKVEYCNKCQTRTKHIRPPVADGSYVPTVCLTCQPHILDATGGHFTFDQFTRGEVARMTRLWGWHE